MIFRRGLENKKNTKNKKMRIILFYFYKKQR
jgi:hypothetical protein